MRRTRRIDGPFIAAPIVEAVRAVVSSCVDPTAAPLLFCVGFGAALRFVSLPISFWADKHAAQMAVAMPHLHVAHHNFLAMHDHPLAGYWDKQLAMKMVTGERDRIFERFGTNNLWFHLPPLLAGIASLSLLSAAATASPAVIPSFISAMTVTYGGVVFDTTPLVAALLTGINAHLLLERRKGFSSRIDVRVKQLKGISRLTLLAATVAAVAGTTTGLSTLWLGMGLVGLLRIGIVSSPLGRHLLSIPEHPLEHGSYGDVLTYSGQKLFLEMRKLQEDPEGANRWEVAKTVIHLECDTRILKILESIGLIDRGEELLQERQRIEKRLQRILDASNKEQDVGKVDMNLVRDKS